MKVKDLIKVMPSDEFIYIDGPSWGMGGFWYSRAHSNFVADKFGDRYIASITADHEKGSPALYITLKEEE